jgi:predicted dehydrogenase
VEVLQRWLGPITAVQAAGKVVVPVRDGYEVQIPDELNVLLEFENGALGTMELSGVASGAPGDGIEIYGVHGSIHYDIASDGVRVGREAREIPAGLRREWTVEEDFIRAVRDLSGPRPRPDFQDGVAYMAVVDAVWDALHSGGRVEVSRDS